MNEITNIVEELNKIEDNTYFKELHKNPSPIKFLESQECFISAIDNWSKALGLLLEKLPSDKERLPIIQNLYEEHGEGNLESSHVNTFREFYKSLGGEKKLKLYNKKLSSYKFIKEFNDTINNKFKSESWIYSVAMLGMIEYTYITVSKNIHEYAKNYINPRAISHYSLHEIVDVKHANDLFNLISSYEKTNPKDIVSGLLAGYNLINKLYNDLSIFIL